MPIPEEKKEKVREALAAAKEIVETTLGRAGDTRGQIGHCIVIAELTKELLR